MGILKQRREEANHCETDHPVSNGSESSLAAPTLSATQRANVSTRRVNPFASAKRTPH